ncbi:porin [Neisseria animalis]|uniref:Porin n=1 Tax=Neisseria animalis TaxID=492 RepID=A0A5P3MPS8_NEIAN|nr:porin [Neisseria animalis]QEY23567.1 porin [Neisseria animalis]ROW32713.1 porin [Neisseria animalis]VEE09237.1 porin [Neisseria animalis]
MKMIFLPLLVFAAAPAWSDVQWYGKVAAGVEAAQIRFDGKSASQNGVADFGSHVGLRGSYPIGGGANVLWQFEQDVPTDGRSDGSLRKQWRERKNGGESFIGISR